MLTKLFNWFFSKPQEQSAAPYKVEAPDAPAVKAAPCCDPTSAPQPAVAPKVPVKAPAKQAKRPAKAAPKVVATVEPKNTAKPRTKKTGVVVGGSSKIIKISKPKAPKKAD